MTIKDFIGEVVISKASKTRYIITEIDGVAIHAKTEEVNSNGCPSNYLWQTGTAPYDNAIVRGSLIFEKEELLEPFKEAYEYYIHNEGKHDQYFYYSRFYD